MPAATRARTFGQRLADEQWSKYARLPAASNGYATTRDLRIPMRDGVDLLADLYEPDVPALGTVLVASPYGWNVIGAAMTGGVFACRGYRVVLVRCRGTFGSGGVFEPFRNEVDDAADVVAWLRRQSWFDGHFATYGYSYCGFFEWAMLMDPPPELAAAVIACSPYDLKTAVFPGGAFLLSTFFEWSFVTSRQEKPLLPLIAGNLAAKGRIGKALASLPLTTAAEIVMGTKAPWYREWVTRRDLSDAWWSRSDLSEALERVEIPVLLLTGWQDGFVRPVLDSYERLAERGVQVGLTVGPWTHAQGGAEGSRTLLPDALDWIDHHLAGRPARREHPVTVFTTGDGAGWQGLDAWPPATVEKVLHPGAGGRLSELPAEPGEVATFTYDPADPTPTYGGAFVTQLSPGFAAGYTDDTRLADRADVLTFTSEPLQARLELAGVAVAELSHSSDNPSCDLFVRLSEVRPDGVSTNVTDGFVRLEASRPGDLVRVGLDPAFHRFAVGSRLRLVVSGGAHPRWERNLGTGHDPATTTALRSSHRRVDLPASRLVLPVAGS